MRSLFVPAAFLGMTLSICSQSRGAEEVSQRIRFTELSGSTPNGLASNRIEDITQDIRGFVWIATDMGLSRFDGWETTLFQASPDDRSGLPTNRLSAIATTAKSAGPIWIGTYTDGLVRLVPETGEIESIVAGTPRGQKLLSNTVTDLAISDDRFLWIGTDSGLNVLDLNSGDIAIAKGDLATARISSISCIDGKEVWIGAEDGTLYRWNAAGKTFLPFWKTTVPITSVAIDPSNDHWIGTRGLGLWKYTPTKDKKPKRVDISPLDVNSICVDANADLWVGARGGLLQFDRRNQEFIKFQHDPRQIDSLVDNTVTEVFQDQSRTLWIGTAGGGTSRFSLDRKWFPHIRSSLDVPGSLPASKVQTISLSPADKVWFGTERGAAVWDPEAKQFQKTSALDLISNLSVEDIIWDETGTTWVASAGAGLTRIAKSGKLTTSRHDDTDASSLPHDNVSALLADGARIFVGTRGGGLAITEAQSEEFTPVTTTSENGIKFVDALSRDPEGRIWIATGSSVHILPRGATIARPFAETFSTAQQLTSTNVSSILAEVDGVVWIGTTDSGLDRFNPLTGEIANFNAAVNGLPDDTVQGLVRDESGLLWVVTRTGVARLDAMQSEFRVFTPEDGLQQADFALDAVAIDSDGILYLGGEDGFNIIDPSDLPEIPRSPNPIFTGLDYFGEPVTPTKGGILEKEIGATEKITMPFDPRARFSIRFGNLDFQFPNRGTFRYMLKGHEFDWRIADTERKATYTGLAAGNYEFVVQFSLDGRQWDGISCSVKVRITPPWWQTWWFRVLAALTAVGVTMGATHLVIRSRIQFLRRNEERLTAERDRAEAALARNLQNRMLIERTTREINSEKREDQILNEALSSITEEFEATHCLIHRLVEIELDDGETEQRLQQIGSFTNLPIPPGTVPPKLTIDCPLVQEIIASPEPTVVSERSALPHTLAAPFSEDAAVSLISLRATFLDEPNGIITFLRVGMDNPWSGETIKLFEALTGQFGIAIAQISTAATEEKYRKHLEDSRHEAEIANRAKSDFLAKMTHELRTPLNAIIGFSDILGEDKTLNPKQRETLDIINNSGEHLLDVINEILDLSKIEAGKIEKNEEEFDFVPLLKSVYEMLSMKAKEKRIGFNFTSESSLPSNILTDRSKIRQILINLMGNAIKFTAQGAVSLSVKAVPAGDPVEIDGKLQRQTRIQFTIKDTGRGIAAEEIPKLFERYSQTESGRRSSEGTGLGLPIARSFIQLLGGDVEVTSVFGEGTTFQFYIECTELAKAEDETSLSTSLDEHTAQLINGFTSPYDEVRVLVAEDQPTNRLLLKKILGRAGFVLAEVENGQEAVEKWHDWHPHIILMDEDMPVMKGSEAAREIKRLATDESDTVIVSLTAYALEQARVAAIEAGCTDFVAKPFRSHELFSVISKHLGVEYTFNAA